MCHGPSRGRQDDELPGARIFHHGSSCFTALSKEAEYMAATVLPSLFYPRATIASRLGPYMTLLGEVPSPRDFIYILNTVRHAVGR